MDALQYDKSRHYSRSVIMMIQRVVGATVDGVWGPKTVGHVEIWQEHHHLKPDGKVGHETLKLIQQAADHRSGDDDGDHDDGNHSPAHGTPEVHGMGTRAAMTASLEDAAAQGIDTVSYWCLPWIMKSPVIAGVISDILAPR